jgi:iron complex transport system ATP-binding protein
MGAALRFDDASVGYGAVPVVRGVSFDVVPGEVVGLIGPNGAGKTTLLRAVSGGARVTGGCVEVEGRDRRAYGSRELARVVGVLPQAAPQAAGFTARRWVELGRHPHLSGLGDLGPADREAVARAMTLTDTERLAEVPVDALSGGDVQRLTLAQALAQEPRVLLLDEPTSHLDLDHALQVLDLVRRLAEEGMAVLGVFHDLGLASRYADRLAVVAGGGLAALGTPREVLTAELLSDVFRVRAVVGTDAVTGAVAVTPVLRTDALAPCSRGRVLVVSGAATGSVLLRRLVLDGWDVACGALNRGDTDQAVAAALGLRRVELPPFGGVDAAAEDAVAALAGEADAVVVAPTPFGTANLGNLRAALASSAPVALLPAEGERDFAGGEASRLLADAVASGRAQEVAEVDLTAWLERTVAS